MLIETQKLQDHFCLCLCVGACVRVFCRVIVDSQKHMASANTLLLNHKAENHHSRLISNTAHLNISAYVVHICIILAPSNETNIVST